MFGKRITLFTIFGFTVRLDLSWLLMAVMVTTAMAVMFGQPPHSFAPAAAWPMAVAVTLGLFASIVLHELSHSLVARLHGMQMKGITLFLLGGVAEMDDEPPTPWAEFTMAIAGPIASVLIAALLFGATLALGAPGPQDPVTAVVSQLALMNIVLAIFNMVPAFPLDGGRVLRSILWGFSRDVGRATRVASTVGAGFGILFIGAGLFFVFVWPRDFQAITWILVGLFVFSAARMSHRNARARAALRGVLVRDLAEPCPDVVPRWIPLDELARDHVLRHRERVLPVVDDGGLVGIVNVAALAAVPREQWSRRTVGEITAPLPMAWMIAPEEGADAALERMNRAGVPQLFVIEDGQIAGLVRVSAIAEHVQLRQELGEP